MDFRLQNWMEDGGSLFYGMVSCYNTEVLLLTIVCDMFGENHAPSTLNTSFVDLEIEWTHCNCCKKKLNVRPYPTLYTFSLSVKRRRLG